MARLRLAALSAGLAQITLACLSIEGIYLGDVVHEGENHELEWSTVKSVRGGGDLWSPPEKGCNRIPCGGFLNNEVHGDRVVVDEEQIMRIRAHMNKRWNGGHIHYELKYGNNPKFTYSPGFEIGEINVAKDADMFDVYKSVRLEPAFNGNATIQLAYHTDGLQRTKFPGMHNHSVTEDTSASFYQCIDITVKSDRPFPEGFDPNSDNGLGANDIDFADIDTLGDGPPSGGMSPFWTAFIVLLVFILLALAVVLYLCYSAPKLNAPPAMDPLIREKEQPLPEPVKPKTTPTPQKPATPESVKEVTHIAYGERSPAKDNTPPKKSETPPPAQDATGSQGRHFHFRYVEDDGGDAEV